MTSASLPATGQDYSAGLHCTWNGPIEKTAMGRSGSEDPGGPTLFRVCPKCGGAVSEIMREHWWAAIARIDLSKPGYEAMMRWGAGRCFPDEETLQNAWHQACEE